jgi:hypothetical protein
MIWAEDAAKNSIEPTCVKQYSVGEFTLRTSKTTIPVRFRIVGVFQYLFSNFGKVNGILILPGKYVTYVKRNN